MLRINKFYYLQILLYHPVYDETKPSFCLELMQIGCVYMQGLNFELHFHLHAQNQQVLLPANLVAVCNQGLITV